MNGVAEREGFLVVYPDGVNESWFEGQDSVGFIDRVLEQTKSEFENDRTRVYSTGFSAGGDISYALGVLRPHQYAAIASVGATPVADFPLPEDFVTPPPRPFPLLTIHGTADPVVPYEGGVGDFDDIIFPPAEQALAEWLASNGSLSPITFQSLPDLNPDDETTVDRFDCSDCGTYVGVSGQEHVAEVVHFRVNGGTHNWRNQRDQWPDHLFNRPITGDISASNEIWDFFSRHELAASPASNPLNLVASTHSIWDQQNQDGIGDHTNTRRRGAIGGTERIITKFDLPGQHGRQLQNATLRIHLEDITGTPPSGIAVFHSVADNDLDQEVSDYESADYVDTALTLATPDAATGEFYDVNVTEYVLADYAADGADATSAFRLQVLSIGDDPIDNFYQIANDSLYARNPTLILTTVPEPGSALLLLASALAAVWVVRRATFC